MLLLTADGGLASQHQHTGAVLMGSRFRMSSDLGLRDELLGGGGVAERRCAGAAGDLPHAAQALQRTKHTPF